MHSLKNTVVAVMLLGVTYGVYQVITTPDPTVSSQDEFMETIVEDMPSSMDSMTSMESASSIPKKLLEAGDEFAGNGTNAFEKTPSLLPERQPAQDTRTAGSSDRELLNSLKQLSQDGPSQTGDTGTQFNPGPSSNRVPIKSDFAANQTFGSGDSTSLPTRPGTADQAGVFDPNVRQTARNAPAEMSAPVTLASTWPQVENMVNQGDYRAALGTLTRFYRDASLTADERTRMLDWLDHLAAKVIYSTEHHVRPTPYIIQPNDTLLTLSERWKVPAQLIININRAKIADPQNLQPGVEIKMLGGPFDAEIDSVDKTMTLFLKNLYAGRFAIEPGAAAKSIPGDFDVVGKASAGNQFGPYWIGLSNGACLHAATASQTNACYVLQSGQAVDVFAILGKESKVRILR